MVISYRHIHDVEANTTHVLFGADTLLGRPLETSNARILNFVKVLHTLGDIDEQVRASCLGTETPDFAGFGDIPAVLVGEDSSADLEIITSVDLALLDTLGEFLIEWRSLDEETVVLVLRLRERNDGRLRLDGLTVTDDRLSDFEGDTSVVLLEILQ